MEEEKTEFDKAVYDYVKIYAEMAGVPAIAKIFVSRCSEGKIFTEQTKRYTDNIELQDTLRGFHLDAEKFWYLCLFVNDIVEGFTVDMVTPLYPRKELTNLAEKLDSIKGEIVKRKDSELADLVCNGELSLKIDNKTVLSITAPNILSTIKDALQYYLKYKEDKGEGWQLGVTPCTIKHKDKSTTFIVSLFRKYLGFFCDVLVADKTVVSSKGKIYEVSTDKLQLIGTMIYILGISNDKRFMKEKGFLRTYTYKGKMKLEPNRYYYIVDNEVGH